MDLGQAAIVDTNQNDLAPERGSKLTLLPLRRSLPGSVAVIGVTTPAVCYAMGDHTFVAVGCPLRLRLGLSRQCGCEAAARFIGSWMQG